MVFLGLQVRLDSGWLIGKLSGGVGHALQVSSRARCCTRDLPSGPGMRRSPRTTSPNASASGAVSRRLCTRPWLISHPCAACQADRSMHIRDLPASAFLMNESPAPFLI